MVAASTKPAIQVRFSRQYGNDRIEIEVQIVAEVGQELFEINRLNDVVKQGIEDWTNNVAPQLRPAPKPGQYDDAISDNWYDVDMVNVVMDKGKKYWKLVCGQWQEYGVTCYPEVFKAAGIPYEKIPNEGFTPLTWKARIIERRDKPARVLEIVYDKAEKSNE